MTLPWPLPQLPPPLPHLNPKTTIKLLPWPPNPLPRPSHQAKESKGASLKFRHAAVAGTDPGPGPGEYPVQDVRPRTDVAKTFGSE